MELFWSHTIRGLKPTANISGRYATNVPIDQMATHIGFSEMYSGKKKPAGQ